MSGALEIAATCLTAVLSLWLGLTVATRSSSPAARVFSVLALTLATWAAAIVVQRLPAAPYVDRPARAIEEVMAAIGLAATGHLSLVIATDGRPRARQRVFAWLAYPVLLLFALPTVIDPANPIAIGAPHFGVGPIPGALLGWAWIAARLVVLIMGGFWLVQALTHSSASLFRRRQLRAALASVGTAACGASLRFLPGIGDADAWIGVSFVALAVVLAAYAVFSAGIFFGPAVADRAFRRSLGGGLVLVGVAGMLVLAESASRLYLGLEVPFFAALVLVVIAALYAPVASALRDIAVRDGPGGVARARLLDALGAGTLGAQPAAAGVQPALARLARALGASGLSVVTPEGAVLASEGVPPSMSTVRPVPLLKDGIVVGELRVGELASGPLTERDEELLQLSAAYVAAALTTGRREEAQADELAQLVEDRADVESRGIALHEALVARAEVNPGLRVRALGPLRVERDGGPVEHWGGDKAGTRQAQALFAFLFDRGERGVAKDEAVELIWPDMELERGDLAFHRTLGGLRATLAGGQASGSRTVRFTNDRYRLEPAVVAWSDVDEFLATLESARTAEGSAQLLLLEAARALYRGEYLDDCPFYGDSAQVEARRTMLRERFVDLMVALGELYEAAGDRLSAAARFRDAAEAAQEDSPAADAGLIRLGL